MTNIATSKIGSVKNIVHGISGNEIQKAICRDLQPAIYFNDCTRGVFVDNGLMTTGGKLFNLFGMIIAEVVEELRKLGIQCYVTDERIALMPAQYLTKFESKTLCKTTIDISPFDLSKIFPTNILNFRYEDANTFTRIVQYLYSDKTSEYVYSSDIESPGYRFRQDGDTLLVNHIDGVVEAIIEFSINDFFLTVSKEVVIDVNRYISELTLQNMSVNETYSLLRQTNFLNRDIS